jgi:septum formation protein
MERILLASRSPRRRELLDEAGIPFDAFAPDVDESLRDDLAPAERVLALAADKALAASSSVEGALPSPPRLVLGADTLVCLPKRRGEAGELALGQPTGIDDARRMIGLLAGRTHIVRTGIALLDRDTGSVRTARSDSAVGFAPMSEEEIEAYLETGEWSGVAGAYRIQGLASFYIDRLEGSWTGVVGLPMRELYVILLAAGYRIPFAGDQGIRRP